MKWLVEIKMALIGRAPPLVGVLALTMGLGSIHMFAARPETCEEMRSAFTAFNREHKFGASRPAATKELTESTFGRPDSVKPFGFSTQWIYEIEGCEGMFTFGASGAMYVFTLGETDGPPKPGQILAFDEYLE
ncbi:MAG: hypothetical protein ACKV2U_13185 [Bryobacteraceae bacterium]